MGVRALVRDNLEHVLDQRRLPWLLVQVDEDTVSGLRRSVTS